MEQKSRFSADFQAQLQAELDRIVDAHICAGNSIAVGCGGEIICRCSSGYADLAAKRPIDDNTLFQMHSLTKPLTVVAVMQLWERGAFQLDDLVSQYIPAWADVKVVHTREDGSEYLLPAKTPVTVRHLLTMTAGTVYGAPGLVGKGMEELSNGLIESRKNGTPWTTMEYITRLAKVPLAFEPGSRFQYSLAIDVLGALVEIWSGMPHDQYCREHIFEPLGMKSAGFLLKDAAPDQLAVPYTRGEDGELTPRWYVATPSINAYKLNNPNYISGGSGLVCNMGDYVNFAVMLARGGTAADGTVILKKETIDLIAAPALTDEQRATFPREGDSCLFGPGYSYGFGVHAVVDKLNQIPIGEWGWAGSLGNWLSIDPVNDIFWVYAHQMTPYNFEEYIPDISRFIYASLQ